MTEREMLEAAARAMGWEGAEYQDMQGWGEVRYGFSTAMWVNEEIGYWNPRVGSHDALELAAALRISVEHSAPGIEKPWVAARFKDERREILCNEPVCDESERGEAMRMAILRCAARIGLKNGCERTGSDGNGGAA